MSEIVDARQLAQRLRVKPATVLAWERRGWIPKLQAGRKPVLFDLDAVEVALQQRAAANVTVALTPSLQEASRE